MVEVRVVEKCFGGNAADVKTGSAEGAALLNAGDLKTISVSRTANRIS